MYDRRDFLLAAVLIGLGTSARAQEKYPTRPIRLLVPFPAGGPVDVMGRLIGQKLSSTLGQQVIIENRPGAGSTLAARAAASADADGYTLLVASAASLAIGPALYNNIDGYAKTNPGRLNIGVPNGAPPHMIAAWFRSH